MEVLVLRPRVLVLILVLTKKSYLHHCCHVHQKLLDLVDVNATIEHFVSSNDTRMSMFGI